MPIILIIPVLFTIIAWWMRKPMLNNTLMILHALIHIAMVPVLYFMPDFPWPIRYFTIDALGIFFYLILSVLYLATALYGVGFLKHPGRSHHTLTATSTMMFVFSMDGAFFADNLGLLWVFIETTTLASALLINYDQTRHSLEASWKYIFICSIGIALAFVGILLLFVAMPPESSLTFAWLVEHAGELSPFWLKISFVFLLIGFGTKLGLAPVHAWLPDAHSEAPAPVSALLSGALLNTALVPILRTMPVMQAAELLPMARNLLLLMGLLSVFIAAVFIVRIHNYKRILAYSSIENMGIVAIALGVGGMALNAMFIHLLGHSMIKGAFFLITGNVLRLYGSKDYREVKGLLERDSRTGWLWLAAFLLLSALPPSPLFFSEFQLALGMVGSGLVWQLALLLVLLTVVVYGMARVSMSMTMGRDNAERKITLPVYQWIIPALLLTAGIAALFMPGFLRNLIEQSVKMIGG